MSLIEKQSKKYLEEAESTIYTAKIIFEKAKEEERDLWFNVVKTCYDAIEQAISAAIVRKNEIIPKQHPLKIKKFINLYSVEEKTKNKIYFWLGRRASAQYVDIKDGDVSVPQDLFEEEDAIKALEESEEIINDIKDIINKSVEEDNKEDIKGEIKEND